jgi:hypothetical protein
MKTVLSLTLGALLACPIFVHAQSTNAAPSGPPPDGGGEWHHHGANLTDAEKAELKKAHEAVEASDPALVTKMKDVMGQMKDAHDSGTEPSDDLKQQAKTLHEQMDKEMVAADPAVAPILAKMKAHHHGPGGPGGGAPPPDSGT